MQLAKMWLVSTHPTKHSANLLLQFLISMWEWYLAHPAMLCSIEQQILKYGGCLNQRLPPYWFHMLHISPPRFIKFCSRCIVTLPGVEDVGSVLLMLNKTINKKYVYINQYRGSDVRITDANRTGLTESLHSLTCVVQKGWQWYTGWNK